MKLRKPQSAKSGILLRIDDRLIHGQITVGWASVYPIRHFVVANDEIAANEWEQDLLRMAAPADARTSVFSLADVIPFVAENSSSRKLIMVIFKGVKDLAHAAEMGLSIKTVNVGGIHFAAGRRELLPYLFLNDEDVALFRKLIAAGFGFECQDVPNGTTYNLANLLRKL